jgi:hypothetical protein
MIVASSPELGKSDRLVHLAEELHDLVRSSVQEGATLDQLERAVFQRVLAMGRTALDLFVHAQGDGNLGETLTTTEGTSLQRSETVHTRTIRTVFGEHSFQAYVYAPGPKRKIALRPIDARLNLPDGPASYLLQEFSQLFCVEKAFGVGKSQLQKVFEQSLSVAVLEDINRAMGEQADRFLDQLPTPPAKEEGEILVATADGKGVPLVQADAQAVPVFEDKERPGNRRMATLGCVYTVDRHVRTPEQIVAALFRDRTVRQPAHRPEPCSKRYRGYFAYSDATDATPLPGAYRTWTWLVEEVTTRHQSGQPLVRLMDGQLSLWEAADACLEEWRAQRRAAGEEPVVIDILDIIHVAGYVWRAAKVFHVHQEHREAFVEERLLRILHGEVRGVVKGLRRMASQRGLRGAALKELRTVCNYLAKNAARMRYDAYLRSGYPIATGVIEGACRHLIKDRMEQGGMRWTLAGAEAMLNVRAVCASSEWEEFNRWRQGEEAKRVHPHRALVDKYEGFEV